MEFGKYRVIAELGRGGTAEVYLAVAQGPQGLGFSKLLVVKCLRERFADDMLYVSMLVDEARLAARLNHPNCVQTIEIGEHAQRFFIAMEYLEGQSLSQILRRGRAAFPLDLHVGVLRDACLGLHHAHELVDYDGHPLQIVHRDVSPQNVFVTYEGVVKVVDFGIAKAVGRTAETKDGLIKGKVAYMAPEQVAGGQVDRRTDIFAVGVMLWEAAMGRRFWGDMEDIAIVGKLISGNLPQRDALGEQVDPDLAEIIRTALSPVAADRFPTADALASGLDTAYLGKMDKRPSPRDLGKWVSSAFEEKRATLRAAVEQQLADLHARRPVHIRQLGTSNEDPTTQPDTVAQDAEVVVIAPPEPDARPAWRRRSLWAFVVLAILASVGGVGVLSRRNVTAKAPAAPSTTAGMPVSLSAPPVDTSVASVASASVPIAPSSDSVRVVLRPTSTQAVRVGPPPVNTSGAADAGVSLVRPTSSSSAPPEASAASSSNANRKRRPIDEDNPFGGP
jgi:serine/threonine-protein kinase